MKKILNLLLVLSFVVGMSSCKKDDENPNTKVVITVKDALGKVKPNTTVHMLDEAASETLGNNPIFAMKSVVTDDNGVATFELQELFDLDVTATQTTLYFTIFEKSSFTTYKVLATAGVTIKRGETINKELKL
ncbi:MAG: hypothetical protein JXA53_05410 [Bacteroidales bacterium]|nr:hypothetical protein [Bacteroidales bacterium]